jgi:hypothetical protein
LLGFAALTPTYINLSLAYSLCLGCEILE